MSLRQRLGPVVGTGVVGALWLVHGKSGSLPTKSYLINNSINSAQTW